MRKRKIKDIDVTQASLSDPALKTQTYPLLFYEKDGDGMHLAYQEDEEHQVFVSVDAHQIACMRLGPSNTYCHFKMNERTVMLKESDYGDYYLMSECRELVVEPGYYKVVYDLYLEAEAIDTITMIWEVNNEI